MIYVFHVFFPAFTYTGDFRFPIHFQWWVIYDSAGIWIQSWMVQFPVSKVHLSYQRICHDRCLFIYLEIWEFLYQFNLLSGSTYSCVLIAFERYLGICHPNTSSRFRNLRYYLVTLVLACFLIDFPRFLEIEVRLELWAKSLCVHDLKFTVNLWWKWCIQAIPIHSITQKQALRFSLLYVVQIDYNSGHSIPYNAVL